MNNNYTLTWTINIEAENPKAAAKKAWILRNGKDSIANVFDVKDDKTGIVTTIDLQTK